MRPESTSDRHSRSAAADRGLSADASALPDARAAVSKRAGALVLLLDHHAQRGGGQVVLEQLALMLRRRGLDVAVAAPSALQRVVMAEDVRWFDASVSGLDTYLAEHAKRSLILVANSYRSLATAHRVAVRL